jgi:fucose permease
MFLVLLAYLAFFSIALPDAMLGVAWPTMRLSFGQSLGALGWVPPFGVAATVVSTFATRHAVARLGIGRLLAVSTLFSAAGLGITAASASVQTFLIGVVVLGLSGGAVDVALNAYAARNFGPRRINFMHASYVIGAATSPALVTLALQLGASWRTPYAMIAVLQLILAGFFTANARRWRFAVKPQAGHPPRSARRWSLFTIPAGVGIAAVVVQTGIESSLALWSYSFLTAAADVPSDLAGLAVSGFWVMMFASRILIGSLAERLGSWTTMGAGAAGLITAAILILVGTASPIAALVGVLIFGVATGPMYPLLILTTADRTTPNNLDRLVAAQAAASAVGAATLPLLFGMAMNADPAMFAPIIAGAAASATLLHLAMRANRTHQPPARTRGRLADLLDAARHARHHATPGPHALVGPAGTVWAFSQSDGHLISR